MMQKNTIKGILRRIQNPTALANLIDFGRTIFLDYKDINILYEDNHLLVVEKPVNIPSQEDRSEDPDLLNLMKAYIKDRYNKPGNVYLGLVHRLDRPAGGVMVFAKTSKAASRLAQELREDGFKKSYRAVIHGQPPYRYKDNLTDYLYKNRRDNMVRVVDKGHYQARKAILDFKVLRSRKNLSLISINLKTGRPHQIRVQLANLGYPLYGDQRYGQKFNKPGMQMALWSSELSFRHPTLKTTMDFHSDPPDEYPWNLFI